MIYDAALLRWSCGNKQPVVKYHNCNVPTCWCYSTIMHRKMGFRKRHYCGVMVGAMASQITSLTIVYSSIHSSADQRRHQSSASLAFVRGIHRWPVNSPYKWPVTRKMFPFDDVIMHMAWAIKTYISLVWDFWTIRRAQDITSELLVLLVVWSAAPNINLVILTCKTL